MPKPNENQPREVVTTRNPKALRVKIMSPDAAYLESESVEANLLYELLTEQRKTNEFLLRLVDASMAL